MRKLFGLATGLAALLGAHAVSAQGVKLGVLSDMSSQYSDATGAGSVAATEMAVEDVGGSVLGRRIEVISADHQAKPDVGASIAREWLDRDGVSAIVDVPVSSVALAVQEITRQRHKIFLDTGGASSDLSGIACSPVAVQWTFDSYSMASVAARAAMQQGLDTWFIIAADYAFGQAMERDARESLEKLGGKVVGHVAAPFGTTDFSQYVLQAQASHAKVVAFASAGGDTIHAIQAATEFKLPEGGQTLIALALNLDDTHSLGLPTVKGMLDVTSFYWDMNDKTRAFSNRFFARMHRMPTEQQASVYSVVGHYLKAVKAAGSTDTDAVLAKMRELPVNDAYATGGTIRPDGRMAHDVYVMQAKTPAESKGEWDLYKLVATIPAKDAVRPLAESTCPLVKKP